MCLVGEKADANSVIYENDTLVIIFLKYSKVMFVIQYLILNMVYVTKKYGIIRRIRRLCFWVSIAIIVAYRRAALLFWFLEASICLQLEPK